MPKVDLEKQRKKLDREITFFHFKKAQRLITKCIKISEKYNDNFFFYYFTAQAYILKDKFDKAMIFLDKALEVKGNDGCTYNDKGLCLAELGRYNEALNCFNNGLEKDKTCVPLYHNKGWLLNLLGRHKDAILCFHKSLELDKARPESLFSMADSYRNMGRIDESIKYFRRTLKIIKGKSKYIYKETKRRLKELETTSEFPQTGS